jgi:signal peptidase II
MVFQSVAATGCISFSSGGLAARYPAGAKLRIDRRDLSQQPGRAIVAAPHDRSIPCMSTVRRIALIVVVLSSCIACDQATKVVAEKYVPRHEAWSYVGDTLRLQLAYNYGAFLSLGDSLPPAWRHGLLSIGVGCVLLGILVYLLISDKIDRRGVIALSLVVAGGVSNLIDRLRYDGYVVDFLNVGVGPVRTGIFNVADMAIMLGVLLLILPRPHQKAATPPT